MSDRTRSGNAYRHTSFHNGGRWAGSGVIEDDYSEESFGGIRYNHSIRPRFPNDDVKPEDLNGPCVVVQEGKMKSRLERSERL